MVLTPPPHEGALDGITMRTIMELAAAAGLPAGFQSLTRYDLYTADECFLTGTGAEIVPVAEVDARRIGRGRVPLPGPVTARLREAFRAMVYGPAA
jgi:branched-chain amino acid aminotransferase